MGTKNEELIPQYANEDVTSAGYRLLDEDYERLIEILFPIEGVQTTIAFDCSESSFDGYQVIFTSALNSNSDYDKTYNFYSNFPKVDYNKLAHFYTFIEKSEIEDFFNDNPNNSFLIQPLCEINELLKDTFSKTELLLEVDSNSMTEDEKELVITINTELDPEKAVEKLDLFFDWYVKNISSELRSKLTIALD
jgi:hypothetical protein